MSELYEKSQRKLELNQILQLLSGCAGSTGGKALCLSLTPSSDLEQVQQLLDETTAAAKLSINKGYPAKISAWDATERAKRALPLWN